jgi:cell wall-associated NlpC family hydrolase
MLVRLVSFLLVAIFLAACETTPPYTYHYIPGRTATLENGLAVAPEKAPRIVREAIWAGNELVGKSYRYGGGHASFYDSAYDCSGAVSYVLHAIGRLETPTPSDGFRHYASGGPGKWMTVYAANGHAFLVVAGLRFDTSYGSGGHGPQWLTKSRPADHYVLRHPEGL